MFGGTLSWTLNIFSTFAFALWFILSLFPALFAGLSTQISGKWQPILIATLWAGLEFLRGETFWLHFPWITPGTAIAPNFFTPIIGVYGVSFIMILSACLILLKNNRLRILGIFFLIVAGATPPISLRIKKHDPVKVALIQNETMNYDDYRIATSELEEEVDAIIWPEYAIGFDPRRFKTTQPEVAKLLENRSQLLVAGGKTWFDEHGDSYANTAFTFDRNQILGTHTKNRLVHFFAEGKKGTEAKAIETSLGKIGTPICFDCDHQDVIRRMTSDGAEIFLIPSMDAKHWTKRQHLQHGQLFRHRAAENSRWLAIASTSGLSQLINPQGETTAQLPLMDEGTLVGEITRDSYRTYFQKGGWLIGPISLGGTLMITIGVIINTIRMKRLSAKA